MFRCSQRWQPVAGRQKTDSDLKEKPERGREKWQALQKSFLQYDFDLSACLNALCILKSSLKDPEPSCHLCSLVVRGSKMNCWCDWHQYRQNKHTKNSLRLLPADISIFQFWKVSEINQKMCLTQQRSSQWFDLITIFSVV